ncbi:MAG: GTP-binding protein [Alphaproteobacteria bacterium]|nr:GTP-binding protein [Alphaproteobacteria bacterium]
MADYQSLIPVNIITGFLGSGKTTLLQRLLASPKLANTAVLINEFGEVSLDHLLLDVVDRETVILESGCVCCTIRGDLAEAMRELHSKRERRVIPPFDRLAIETTGLADPAPIVSTLLAEPVLRHHFRLGNIIATIDAANAALHLRNNPESVKQAAIADRLVLTKSDLVDDQALAKNRSALSQLNRTAPIIDVHDEDFDPDDLMASDVYDDEAKAAEVRRWLAGHEHHADDGRSHHGDDIQTFSLIVDQPIDWTAFGIWLTMLLHRHGEQVLRVKGILNVAGQDTPVMIHGVQHVVHPPAHLETWPDDDHRSRIVFILRGLDQALIKRSLAAFTSRRLEA